ncbi:MAG: D-2-hydroxyacid dehydrogenase [Lachnospiraceae bacterium]|jgi:lactate dehydrogenase-like 2-hydroxyacid dehydrogenase|nr:D-2-hydroxyacid dehydrogenase [Lachnospiraceae bacterium]MCI9101307.1 D-2-hydroxyacid dehydrogenase [Lachnospiraceae bacterium]MCI9357753.1 D-2-hydroxyacid dehydrogenase [Lachnospiraceae bacterium]
MKIVILERNSVGEDVSVDCLHELGELTVYPNTAAGEVESRVKEAEIVIANKSPLNEETLKHASSLKLICELATGYDNVDLEYCDRRGIRVVNVVDYSTAAVAQHTFALCFYVLEKLHHYDHYVKSGQYAAQDRFSNFDIPFTELDKKTWGIAGMGNIGRRVAKIAEAFGCKVIFYSTSGSSTCTEYERVDFDTLLRTSDFLSLHCPLSDKTRNLIDLEALRKMKKSAILVNVARGPVVDDEALYTALTEHMIAGAGLDVTGTEPMQDSNPLSKIMDSNRLIITPHLAWASIEARKRAVEETYQNIDAFCRGEKRNAVGNC